MNNIQRIINGYYLVGLIRVGITSNFDVVTGTTTSLKFDNIYDDDFDAVENSGSHTIITLPESCDYYRAAWQTGFLAKAGAFRYFHYMEDSLSGTPEGMPVGRDMWNPAVNVSMYPSRCSGIRQMPTLASLRELHFNFYHNEGANLTLYGGTACEWALELYKKY